MAGAARAAVAPSRRRLADSIRRLAAHTHSALGAIFDSGYAPADHLAVPMPCGLEVSELWVSYGQRVALAGVTARLSAGSLTAVVGPNGAGKSTLLKSVARRLPPSRGHVRWLPSAARPRLAYLPQSAELDRDFPITVRELVALGCWARVGGFRVLTQDLLTEIDAALAATGLEGHADRRIRELSVGELQRALFARVILQNASVILLDEPFMAVDQRTTEELLDFVGRWHREGRTVIAVIHDFEQVRAHFPNALLLAKRVIAHGDSQTVLCPDNIARARAGLTASARAWSANE